MLPGEVELVPNEQVCQGDWILRYITHTFYVNGEALVLAKGESLGV